MCAWIESHQSLLTHRKTIRAVSLLKVDRHKFIGHLHALWWWALDSAEDGNLASVTDPEIALAAGWPVGRAEQFVAALSEAGFLNANRQLHDWDDYAGKLVDRRRRNRDRKREARALSDARPEDVPRTTRGHPEDVARMSGATQHNPTRPNTTKQNSTIPPPPTPSDADASAAAAGALDSDFGRISTLYEENIGKLTPTVKTRLEELTTDIPEMTALWFEAAVREAVKHNARNLAYIEAVLQRWQRDGFQSGVPPGKNSRHGQVMHGTPRGRRLSNDPRIIRTEADLEAALAQRQGQGP